MANVEDVYNAVAIRGSAVGEVMFYGRGAGEMPTASACVSDVLESLRRSPRQEGLGWSSDADGFVDPAEVPTRFYFRIEGSLMDAAMAFGQVEVLSEDGETGFLTDSITLREALEKSECLNVLARLRVMG